MTDISKSLDLDAEVDRRLQRIAKLYVTSEAIREAVESIHKLRRTGYRGLDATACCYLVTGPTNSGKSRLFSSYCARPDAQPVGDLLPVVRMTMPTSFTPIRFFNALLTALGTETFASHDIDRVRTRVRVQIKAKQVELLMIEEVQHIVDKRQGNAGYWAADMIKEFLLDRLKVPVVLNGIEVSEELFKKNTQLLSRRKGVTRLRALDWKDLTDRGRFKAAIEAFEKASAFPTQAGLSEDDAAERLQRATGGLLGNLSNLFEEAVEIGTRKGAIAVDLPLLAVAHAKLSSDASANWQNVLTARQLPVAGKAPDESRVTRLRKNRKD